MSRAATDEVIEGRAAISVNDPGTPVPQGWSRVRLTDIARLESGHTPSRKHPEWWGGDVPWLSLPDAREHHGGVILDTTQKTNEAGLANSAARLLPKDTVCLSRTASVGYVVRLGRPMATSQDFVNWVPSKALDSRFLAYALLAEGKHLLNFGMGTTHTTIYFPAVQAFHLTLAPLAEQGRIVEKAEALLDQANRAKERLDRVPLILKRFRQSVLAAAFSGDLTPMFDASNWREATLGSVIDGFEAGRNLRCQGRPAAGTEYGVLKISAVTWGAFRPEENKALLPGDKPKPHELVRKDDLLISRANTYDLVGAVVLVDRDHPRLMLPDKVLRLRLKPGAVDPRYLVHFLRSKAVRDHFEENATGTSDSMRNLSQPKISATPLRLPSLHEQRVIVDSIERLLAIGDAIETRVDRARRAAEKISPAVLSKAFSGELVPTEADLAHIEGRTFESASELLTRVTANLRIDSPSSVSGERPSRGPRRGGRPVPA